MSGYLPSLLRQARGVSAGLRLRPRARFESVVPELELDVEVEVPPPRASRPQPELATRTAAIAAAVPASVVPEPVPKSAAREPDRVVSASPESLRDVHHTTLESHVQREEHRHETHTREEIIRRVHEVERMREIAPRPTELARPERVASANSATQLSGSGERSAPPAPPLVVAAQREKASPASSSSMVERLREFHERRAVRPDPAPDVTVVIGRLDVRVVRDRNDERPDTRSRRAAEDGAQRAAPTLSDYLSRRS